MVHLWVSLNFLSSIKIVIFLGTGNYENDTDRSGKYRGEVRKVQLVCDPRSGDYFPFDTNKIFYEST